MESSQAKFKIKDLLCEKSKLTIEYSDYLSQLNNLKQIKLKSLGFNLGKNEEDKKIKEYFLAILNRKDALNDIFLK